MNKALDHLQMLTGGNLGRSSIFGLGIMPYITSSIIFMLLGEVLPALKKLKEEGQTGYKKIQEYTRYLTVPICVIQAMMFLKMTLEVVASFPFSPVGYEQVIGEKQSWFTVDKFFHVFLSIALLFVLWSILNGDIKLALVITLVMHLGYELFQYGIQPMEVGSDSLIDEIVSLASILIAAFFLHKMRKNE